MNLVRRKLIHEYIASKDVRPEPWAVYSRDNIAEFDQHILSIKEAVKPSSRAQKPKLTKNEGSSKAKPKPNDSGQS